MYEETGCFDPNSMAEGANNGFTPMVPNCNPLPPPLMAASTTNSHNSCEDNLKPSMEELSYHPHQEDSSAAHAVEIQLQQQLALSSDQIQNNVHLMLQVIHDTNQVRSFGRSNWGTHVQEMQAEGFADPRPHHPQQDHQIELQNGHQAFNVSASLGETPFSPTPDLLNLLHLPKCSPSSLLPNSSIPFGNPNPQATLGYVGDIPPADTTSASSVLYDPLFHLNLPPQPPLFRELFHSLPSGYSLPVSRGHSLFGGTDEQREGSAGMYHDGDGTQFIDNGILEFNRDMACIGGGREAGKLTKHFTTERQRREQMNDKFNALRSLVPNSTKSDRASVVGDGIEYIKELLRTVNELKILVEKKRCGRERSKRHKTTEDDAAVNVESSNMKPIGEPAQSYNSTSLRSSWLQRKSKVTEVDVRIIDDEVTIKLVQKKKINCLLCVSKILDELQLDLHHVAGGHIGEHYSFLFNTKIYEGSSVHASAIANKLIEVVDREYAAVPPTSCY